jgi:hypothetical protein
LVDLGWRRWLDSALTKFLLEVAASRKNTEAKWSGQKQSQKLAHIFALSIFDVPLRIGIWFCLQGKRWIQQSWMLVDNSTIKTLACQIAFMEIMDVIQTLHMLYDLESPEDFD